MNIEEFFDGLIISIDLPSLQKLDEDKPFCDIADFDSLATLGVMTYCNIEFNKTIDGNWLWDEKITPKQLFDHIKK